MYKKVITIILLLLAFFPCNVFAKDKTPIHEVVDISINYGVQMANIYDDWESVLEPMLLDAYTFKESVSQKDFEKLKQKSKVAFDEMQKKITELEKLDVSYPVTEYKRAWIVIFKIMQQEMNWFVTSGYDAIKAEYKHQTKYSIFTRANQKAIKYALEDLNRECVILTGMNQKSLYQIGAEWMKNKK